MVEKKYTYNANMWVAIALSSMRVAWNNALLILNNKVFYYV